MRSSYQKNNYGSLLESLVVIHKPKLVVECGVLDGYSLLGIADAMPKGKVIAYDLFEDYEFKSSKQESVQSRLDGMGLSNVTLVKQDAIEAAKNHRNNSIDILHIDISNDGEKLFDMFEAWSDKVKKDGLIIFEGGSKERDKVDWMKKYKRPSIVDFKMELDSRFDFEFVTLTPYPSLTICRRVE